MVASGEHGLGDRSSVAPPDGFDRLEDDSDGVIGRAGVRLRLHAVGALVALVETRPLALEQRRRDAAEGDQRPLGRLAGVAEEGALEEGVRGEHADLRDRLADVTPQSAGTALDDAAVVDEITAGPPDPVG